LINHHLHEVDLVAITCDRELFSAHEEDQLKAI